MIWQKFALRVYQLNKKWEGVLISDMHVQNKQ